MSTPKISVLVCTYNRSTLLRACLDGLVAQTAGPKDFEIVVIDNNSDDDTAGVIAEFSGAFPNISGRFEVRQGLAIARNAGLHAASADWVAFIDDDAVPYVDWVHRLIRRIEEVPEDVTMIGGDVDPIWGDTPPDWLTPGMVRALSAGLNWSGEARFVDGRDEWLFEGASAYRLQPVLANGGFPPQLGRKGELLLSGEAALHYRLIDQGLRFFYDPEIRIQHHIAADRLTKDWFRRRYFWQGVTAARVADYLRQHGLQDGGAVRVDLPASDSAWLDVFDETSTAPFERSLATIYGLGYLLASQALI